MLKRALNCGRVSYCKLKYLQYLNTRNFQSGIIVAAKQFVDTENNYAHSILEKSLKPYQLFRPDIGAGYRDEEKHLLKSVLNATTSQENITSEDLVKKFRAFVHYLESDQNSSITEKRFQPFTQLVGDSCHKLSDEQLLDLLGLLNRLPNVVSVKAPNYVELWNALDMEFCRRVDSWDIDQLLRACDAWYRLDLARITEFVREALKKLGRKVLKFRPEQLVQVMFLCNVSRRPLYEMFDFETNLAKCVDKMTLDELGVMSMGFFKTQTPIRNPELIEQLYLRLMAQLDTVEDITLVAILKILRYSTKLTQVHLTEQLMEALLPQIDRLSLLSCLHVALLGSDMQCCNDELLERVLQRFSNDIENTRLKDLERIAFVIGVFNLKTPSGIEEELCPKIMSTLQNRFKEILKHPRCFVNCLHFLSLRGYYDVEMISAALDKRFIHHAYGKNALLGREVFQLDSFVRINLKDSNYMGNMLSDKMRGTMGKMLTHYIPERNSRFKLSLADRVLLEIKEATDRLIRVNSFKHVLPHYERPDVVICFDRKQRKALPLSTNCPADYSGIILTRDELIEATEKSNIDTVVLMVAGWNNVVRVKDRLTGLFEMKLQQLRLLGHKPVVIYWYEWRGLETHADRQNFLKRKLATAINL